MQRKPLSPKSRGKTILSETCEWSALPTSSDRLGVAAMLTACANYMLRYWESHYTDDVKMPLLAHALVDWANDPSKDNMDTVVSAYGSVSGPTRYSSYDLGLCDPFKIDFVGSDCPADYAGVSIVWAAAAVANMNDHAVFHVLAQRSIDCALEAVTRMMGERAPHDEAQDTCRKAEEHLRGQILEALDYPPFVSGLTHNQRPGRKV